MLFTLQKGPRNATESENRDPGPYHTQSLTDSSMEHVQPTHQVS